MKEIRQLETYLLSWFTGGGLAGNRDTGGSPHSGHWQGALQVMLVALVMMLLAPGRMWATDYYSVNGVNAINNGSSYDVDDSFGKNDNSIGFVVCREAIEQSNRDLEIYDPIISIVGPDGTKTIKSFSGMDFTVGSYTAKTSSLGTVKVEISNGKESKYNGKWQCFHKVTASFDKIPSGCTVSLKLEYKIRCYGGQHLSEVGSNDREKTIQVSGSASSLDITPTVTEESYGNIKLDFGESVSGAATLNGTTTSFTDKSTVTIDRPSYYQELTLATKLQSGYLYQKSAISQKLPCYPNASSVKVDPDPWTKTAVVSWSQGKMNGAKTDGYYGIVLADESKSTYKFVKVVSASDRSYTHSTGDIVPYNKNWKYFVFYIPQVWKDKVDADTWKTYCDVNSTNIAAWSGNFKYDTSFKITLSATKGGKLTWTCPDFGKNNEKASSYTFSIKRATVTDNKVGEFKEIASKTANTDKTYDAELSANDEYVFRIDVNDVFGNTVSSNESAPLISTEYPYVTSLSATKGTLDGSVHLEWTAHQTGLEAKYQLQRRSLGVQGNKKNSEWTSIYTVSGTADNFTYNDVTAVNGVYYEYKITSTYNNKHETYCKSIGFPTHTGQIAGTINFEGGTAVEDVNVKLTPVNDDGEKIATYALPVNGKGNGLLWTLDNDKFNNNFNSNGKYVWTAQMYIKPDLSKSSDYCELLQMGNFCVTLAKKDNSFVPYYKTYGNSWSENSALTEETAPTFTVVDATDGYTSTEKAGSLFDNNTGTKWCVVDGTFPYYVTVKSSKKIKLSGYTFVTGNDNGNSGCTGRNPKSWKIYGSNDNSSWTLIDEVNNDTKMEDKNATPYTYAVNSSEEYQYYKLEISKLSKGSNGFYSITIGVPGSLQKLSNGTTLAISEWQLDNGTGLKIPDGKYSSVTFAYDGSSLTTTVKYKDDSGDIVTETGSQSLSFPTTNGDICVGGITKGTSTENGYHGYIDDVRFYGGKALTLDEIAKTYNHYLSGNEKNLVAYWPMDEGLDGQTEAYDYSRTSGEPNANHATIRNNASLVNCVPDDDQLGLTALTDQAGNYTINGINYYGSGTTYKIMPTKGIHSFDPASEIRFFDSHNSNHNGIDFKDNSSFPVSGTVYFANTNIPVQDCYLYVDGQAASVDGEAVKTNSLGEYSLNVAIGDHTISVKKDGHEFLSDGKYTGSFYDEVKNLLFTDTTTVAVVGRVCGGEVENSYGYGLGLSKNNIGKARVVLSVDSRYNLNAVNTGDGTKDAKTARTFNLDINDADNLNKSVTAETCPKATVMVGDANYDHSHIVLYTDEKTGEFSAMLPPVKYAVESVSIVNDGDELNKNYFNELKFDAIDASTATAYSTDSILSADSTSYIKYKYNAKLNLTTYQSDNSLEITQTSPAPAKDSETMFGIESAQYAPSDDAEKETVTFYSGTTYNYQRPIFRKGDSYTFHVSGYQTYRNYDKGATDPVVDKMWMKNAEIQLDNGMAASCYAVDSATNEPILIAQDYVTLNDQGQADYVFTAGFPNITESEGFMKSMDVTINYGSKSTRWVCPLSNANNGVFSAIVLGSIPLGTDFVTAGPERVEMVLRDPPGSNSFATWEAGSTVTSTYTLNDTESSGVGGGFELNLIPELNSYSGLGIMVGVTVTPKLETKFSSLTTTTTGTSNTKTHTIVTTESVSTSSSPQFDGPDADIFIGSNTNTLIGQVRNVDFDKSSGEWKLALKTKTSFGEQFSTTFNYTRYFIENTLIPKYQAIIDELNSSNYSGTSVKNAAGEEIAKVDSIARLNNNIMLWKRQLASDECDKVFAINNSTDYLIENISFDAGTSIVHSYETDNTSVIAKDTTKIVNNQTTETFGMMANKAGVYGNVVVTINNQTKNSNTESSLEKSKFSFTLKDPDIYDNYSVDVLRSHEGWSPIFRTRAGTSSGNFEPQRMTKYLKLASEEEWSSIKYTAEQEIMASTKKAYVPVIETVDNQMNYINNPNGTSVNIPLVLKNNSEVDGSAGYFTLKLDAAANAKNAQVTCNGTDLGGGVAYRLAYGKPDTVYVSVKQTDKTVKDYDLKFLLADNTQSSNSNAVTLHVEFTDASSPITLTPQKLYCSGTDRKVTMKLSDYMLDVTNLKQIGFEYWKPGETDWSTMRKVWTVRNKFVILSDEAPKDSTQLNSFTYDFDMANMIDGEYKVRAFTMAQPAGTPVYAYSDVFTIVKDTIAPQVLEFTPANGGIYTGDGAVKATFNEDILHTALNTSNVLLKGNLDNNASNHEVSLYCIGNSMNTESKLNVMNGEGSINMYIKREPKGAGHTENSTLLSKASESGNKFSIQIDNEGHLVLNMGSTTLTSQHTIPENQWTFLNIAAKSRYLQAKCCPENTNETINLFDFQNVDGIALSTGSTGKISVGENFVGYIHGMTIWDKYRDFETATSEKENTLTQFTTNLKAYWPMNRGYGLTAEEVVSGNSLVLNNENEWHIERATGNENYSLSCEPSQRYDVTLGNTCTTRDDDDFTLQFWFAGNVSQNNDCVIYGYKDTYLSFSNETGKLTQYCGENAHLIGDESYKTNAWHTFTMTVNKSKNGNAIIYIDGKSKVSFPASEVDNLGDVLKLGGNFYGNIDELRIWRGIMDATTIQTTMHEKINPSVVGTSLACYLPFEETTQDAASNQDKTDFSLKDQAIHTGLEEKDIPVMYEEYGGNISGTTLITPPVKSATKMTSVKFNLVTSERTVQLVITEDDKNIQGRRLYAIISGVSDMAGNTSSAISWNFLVNLDKVAWSDSSFVASAKDLTQVTKTVSVVNKTSTTQSWYIDNIPSWMSLSTTQGSVQAYSSKDIEVTFTQNVPMGVTNGYITLHEVETGFSKPLYYTIYRSYNQPDWIVNDGYENTMNIVAQVVMNGSKQENTHSILGVFDASGNVLGKTSPVYEERGGGYFYPVTIYGDVNTGTLSFKFYDANTGLVHPDVTGTNTITFVANDVLGSYHNPFVFTVGDNVEHSVELTTDYDLFSINVIPNDNAIDNILTAKDKNGHQLINGTQVWSQEGFSEFNGTKWGNGITTIDAGKSYMWHFPAADTERSYTFTAVGKLASDANQELNIKNGWNWLGANVTSSVYLKYAFADMDCQEGDFIKTKVVFASYEQGGWIGNLKYVMAGHGYLYKSTATEDKQFAYPTTSALSGSAYASQAKGGSGLMANGSRLTSNSQLYYGGADVYKYSEAMAITCVLKCGDEIMTGAEVAAFDQSGELRAENVTDDSDNKHIIYLYAHGEDETPLTFKAVIGKGDDAKVYDIQESFNFVGTTSKGSINDPVVLTISPTAINEIHADADADANAKVYTVGGAQVKKSSAQGIYINNGKKYNK